MFGDEHGGSTRSANSASHPDSTVANAALRGMPGRVVLGATGEAILAVTREGVFMKRSWTALAVALPAIFAAIGCNDYGDTFQVPTGGSISSLSPANVTAGSPQFT